jgi:signal transduction histidine kinase
LKKTSIIFIFLSIYIVAAFTWWTFAHINDNKTIYQGERKMLEVLCYKATIDVNGAIQQQLFNDTNDVKKYFNTNFPQLEILFETTSATSFDNFLIRPKEEAYITIKKTFNRKMWMYTLEGVVMVVLLFWGIILIYRSFQNRITLKRQQSNFLLSITHELKTPLTSIKLCLETIRKRNLDPEQTQLFIHNSLLDVDRLHDLVENLLLAARLDNHKYELDLKEINLSALVSETVEKFAAPRNIQQRVI